MKFNLETPRSGGRRRSYTNNVGDDTEHNAGTEVVSAAKEALTSLQYLEAFLWQRDPSGLSIHNQKKPLKMRKEARKSAKFIDPKSRPKLVKKSVNTKPSQPIPKLSDIEEKVEDLLDHLKISS